MKEEYLDELFTCVYEYVDFLVDESLQQKKATAKPKTNATEIAKCMISLCQTFLLMSSDLWLIVECRDESCFMAYGIKLNILNEIFICFIQV